MSMDYLSFYIKPQPLCPTCGRVLSVGKEHGFAMAWCPVHKTVGHAAAFDWANKPEGCQTCGMPLKYRPPTRPDVPPEKFCDVHGVQGHGIPTKGAVVRLFPSRYEMQQCTTCGREMRKPTGYTPGSCEACKDVRHSLADFLSNDPNGLNRAFVVSLLAGTEAAQ